ncbi:dipeptidase [Sphingobium boeckii]|uniref:Microsomal dipeptidase-like Zn-dependent dipeptidase n=1 Tax=Sphingobium boeckii TaxID=1082345 RepID=A0A7W9EE86_9SPHN|nr:microsomal dipeptidase-like Zn-dependent dipeptidase [Sphingobium boeckii]
MKRAIGIGLAMLLILAGVGFFGVAPGVVERTMNVVQPGELPEVSAETAELHRTLHLVDMHADTLMWQRDLLSETWQGQVDLRRLEAGNVALQIFSSVTKTPKGQNYDANGEDSDNITLLTIAQLQPPWTWTSLLQRSLFHAEKLQKAEAGSNGRLRIVRSGADVQTLIADRVAGKTVTGALLSIEGLQDLEGKATNLDVLYKAGFRMAGPAHFFDNELAGSMHGLKKGGLRPLGRQVIQAMESKGMIVDIAHASHQSVADILAMATRPVVSSHGGVQATCKVNRNLTDDEIRGVARTGGVIGIGYWEGAICDTSTEAVADAIAHVRDLVGVKHVGLGSDFDGAVTTRWDASQLAAVTQALVDRRFTPSEIRAVMGGNVIRLLEQGLVPKQP